MLKAYGYQVRRCGAYCEGRCFEKHGFVTVFGGSIPPPPLPFSSIRTAAGVVQYPGEKFLSALTAGRAVRFFTVAYLANVYGPRMVSFVSRHYRPTMYLLIALAVIAGVGALIYFKWYRPKAPREGGRARPSEHQ